MEDLNLSIIIVTSPYVNMPSTVMIDKVIESFQFIDGLEGLPVIIVMDGYKISEEVRTKKGRITSEMVELYENYYEALKLKYPNPQYTIIRSNQHNGFALCVKIGLEACSTKYALIAQHDRAFVKSFHRIKELLNSMETYEHIRYIGFPTANTITHDRVLAAPYNLDCLNQPIVKYSLGNNLYLQPLIFWFDTQHLCHVSRYLKIYQPYKSVPREYFDKIGLKNIKDMFLRPGDFIEDRFGQIQRNLLIEFSEKYSSEDVINLFKWYGSYLCFPVEVEYDPYDIKHAQLGSSVDVMVSHLHGRQTDVQKVEEYAKVFGSDKIKNRRYFSLIGEIPLDFNSIKPVEVINENFDEAIESFSQINLSLDLA